MVWGKYRIVPLLTEILDLPLIKSKIENKDHKTDHVSINIYFKHTSSSFHFTYWPAVWFGCQFWSPTKANLTLWNKRLYIIHLNSKTHFCDYDTFFHYFFITSDAQAQCARLFDRNSKECVEQKELSFFRFDHIHSAT